MICRDAVIEDARALAQVSVEAWQAAYTGLMPADYLAGLDATDGAKRFEQAIRAGRSILVLELDSSIVGFSFYASSRDDDASSVTGEVIAINLLPSHWRRGLGRVLLEETGRRLHQEGFSDATLWVLHDNDRARQFYEAMGWRSDGAEKHDDKLTGFPLHEVRYRRRLP
jgi:GNAT superfamily N-acetyltransferase